MTKLFRVIAIVVLTIAAFGGTVAAYDGAKKEIILIDGDEEKSYTTRTRTVEEFCRRKRHNCLQRRPY